MGRISPTLRLLNQPELHWIWPSSAEACWLSSLVYNHWMAGKPPQKHFKLLLHKLPLIGWLAYFWGGGIWLSSVQRERGGCACMLYEFVFCSPWPEHLLEIAQYGQVVWCVCVKYLSCSQRDNLAWDILQRYLPAKISTFNISLTEERPMWSS